jgi:hypothetical protein
MCFGVLGNYLISRTRTSSLVRNNASATEFTRLGPCNFFLFPKLKRSMKGRTFATIEEIKTASLEELKTIPKSASKIVKSADTVYYI